MPELPMFPLGTVLFPHMVLPLHVFEPRYRRLMRDLVSGSGEFGVVLISRGHEVGGDDERTDVGTVARLLQAEELDDGRWLVVAIGSRRIGVERWLPDDPYPRASVRDLPERHDDVEVVRWTERLAPRIRHVLAMRTELGDETAEPRFEISPELDVACWQPAVVTPLNPYDANRVLAVDDCGERLALVDELLDTVEDALAFRLQSGAG